MSSVRRRAGKLRTVAIVGAILVAVAVSGCGDSGGAPSGVATNPVIQGGGSPSGSASPGAGGSSVRTVLSPLGLNIHSDPALSAPHLGTAAQGTVLTVLDHTDQNGGWFKVQGQTITGWITADSSLTAPGQFQQYSSTQRQFSAFYPANWTFADEPADVLFHPINGPQTIVERSGASTADFGPTGATGYVGAGQETVVVCGVTGDLDRYAHTGTAPPSPAPGSAGRMALLAQVRLRLDGTHALALDFNYAAPADLDVFRAFFNSMTFPFPQCQAPAPPASPSPS